MRRIEYFPKGGMCAVCERRNNDCSRLKFEDMPAIVGGTDTMVIVRCTKFNRMNDEKTPKQEAMS